MIKPQLKDSKDLFEQLKAIKEAFKHNVKITLFVIDKDLVVIGASRLTSEDMEHLGMEEEEGELPNNKNYFG